MGKTTVVLAIAYKLKEREVRVGGIVSTEVRTNNVRTGFEFIDFTTNDREVLASLTGNGPRVGKYFVNLSGYTQHPLATTMVDVLFGAARH